MNMDSVMSSFQLIRIRIRISWCELAMNHCKVFIVNNTLSSIKVSFPLN